jgi:hypothetical protein
MGKRRTIGRKRWAIRFREPNAAASKIDTRVSEMGSGTGVAAVIVKSLEPNVIASDPVSAKVLHGEVPSEVGSGGPIRAGWPRTVVPANWKIIAPIGALVLQPPSRLVPTEPNKKQPSAGPPISVASPVVMDHVEVPSVTLNGTTGMI